MGVRFWSKVQKGDATECWPWLGGGDKHGRGSFTPSVALRDQLQAETGMLLKMVLAPRMALYLTNGVFPKLYVLHSCDNPACCNPAHLFEGTHQDNMDDMIAKGRYKVSRCKLTAEDVVDIIRRRSEGEQVLEIAASYGMSSSHLSRVSRGLHPV